MFDFFYTYITTTILLLIFFDKNIIKSCYILYHYIFYLVFTESVLRVQDFGGGGGGSLRTPLAEQFRNQLGSEMLWSTFVVLIILNAVQYLNDLNLSYN